MRFLVVTPIGTACVSGIRAEQDSSETPYAASRPIGRWRTIMNRMLEDTRAFAAEEVTDLMEQFVSPRGARCAGRSVGGRS
jgi:hypothetical protein